jgi:hypothetical protein
VEVGATVPGPTTQEDAKLTQYTARVTAEHAAEGKHSLKFTDGPGQKYSFTPLVYYRCRFTEGRMTGRFALRIDAAGQFRYQWRQYANGYRSGPTVDILPGGKVTRGGKVLLTLPTDRWIRFEVACNLGETTARTFTLTVHLPGESDARVFADLPYDEGFSRLDWVGLISNGQRESTIYLDALEIRPGP